MSVGVRGRVPACVWVLWESECVCVGVSVSVSLLRSSSLLNNERPWGRQHQVWGGGWEDVDKPSLPFYLHP